MKAPKHTISRMVITPAENGGHSVEHNYKPEPTIRSGSMRGGFDSGYVEPTTHAFGKGEHQKMFDHIAEHLGISEDQVERDEEKVSPGIHKKVAAMEAKKK
jgi:hypothetical protein